MIVDPRVDRALESMRAAFSLSVAEYTIARLSVDGVRGHRELALIRNVAPSTIKKQVQHLLAKTGHACLRELVISVLTYALAWERE